MRVGGLKGWRADARGELAEKVPGGWSEAGIDDGAALEMDEYGEEGADARRIQGIAGEAVAEAWIRLVGDGEGIVGAGVLNGREVGEGFAVEAEVDKLAGDFFQALLELTVGDCRVYPLLGEALGVEDAAELLGELHGGRRRRMNGGKGVEGRSRRARADMICEATDSRKSLYEEAPRTNI